MGKLYLVSTGPGALDLIVPRAVRALESSSIIIGHQLYLDLIQPLIAGKQQLSTPLGQELERVDIAIEKSRENTVSLISSGDSGVYGLAGLAFERLRQQGATIDVEVIPGVTSATASASLLGAPLSHDFVALSLSDILVPRETILKRAVSACAGDFVTVLYNVQSARRQGLIYEVLEKLRVGRDSKTPCGVVTNAYRPGEKHQIVAFEELFAMNFDMLTTLVIGNSATVVYQGRMITQRGYLNESGK
jgi:precorrin-3B C17-methyltransferase